MNDKIFLKLQTILPKFKRVIPQSQKNHLIPLQNYLNPPTYII